MADRLRFESVDQVLAAAAVWDGCDYLLLAVVGDDGRERQALRRNLHGAPVEEVVVDLPAALSAGGPRRGRVYAMLRGGRRLGKLTVRLVPEGARSAGPRGAARSSERGDMEELRSRLADTESALAVTSQHLRQVVANHTALEREVAAAIRVLRLLRQDDGV